MDSHQTPEQKRALFIIMLFTFFMGMGFDMIMPLVIGHYVGDLHFMATQVALALAMRKFIQQGLSVFGGYLADHVDIKKLIALGVGIRTIGFLMLGFSDTFLMLLFSMFLTGLGGILFETPYQTAIIFLTTQKNRAKYYALNNTLNGVASTAGPLLGALLLAYDFQWVCIAAAACFFVNFLISIFFLPSIYNTSEQILSIQKSSSILFHDRRYLFYVLMMVIFWLAASQIDISYSLKIQDMTGNAKSVSWIFAIYASLTALFQYPVISVFSRFLNSTQMVVLGMFLLTFVFIDMMFVETLIGLLFNVVLFTFCMLLGRPNQQVLGANLADERCAGFYLGFKGISFALGSGFGNFMGGLFYDLTLGTAYTSYPWLLYAVISCVCSIGFFFAMSWFEAPKVEIKTADSL